LGRTLEIKKEDGENQGRIKNMTGWVGKRHRRSPTQYLIKCNNGKRTVESGIRKK